MEELGKKIDQLSNQLTDLRIEIWTKYTLYTWQWWMFVAMCVLPLALFLYWLCKRPRPLATFAYYGLAYILNRNVDDAATAADLYDYRMQLEPVIPSFLPANLFVIPMILAIVYAWFSRWKPYLVAAFLFAALSAYTALPLFKLAGIYLTKAWSPHYSFAVLFGLAIVTKIVIDALVGRNRTLEARMK